MGKYKVKSPQLQPLHAQADQLKRRFRKFRISHVYRAGNSVADGLVNEALDAAH